MKKLWEWLKKAWVWIKTKAWPFIKTHWQLVVGALVAIGGVVMAVRIVYGKKGKVISAFPFFPVNGDDTAVRIADPRDQGNWVTVKLPDGVKYKDVAAVGLASLNSADVVVEIKHEIPDRTH
jgi:hypothetical protein